MIKNLDAPTRRILSFPAIRPCESVSPATLLSCLVTLAHTICDYKSKPFPTNRRNAIELIRLVQNILIFLEDMRNYDQSKLPGSISLYLSELHFIFQKILFLLEDCTREDARVWMVVKSRKASNQFRGLIRAIGVALDVFPLEATEDASVEVNELVGLVKRQCLNSSLDFKPEDKRVLEKIHLILSQFENGVNPESSDLEWVVSSLGISSWSECNKEIKFLDCEIDLERSTAEKKDLGVLNSLMGFMIYCRCTLFNVIDSDKATAADQEVCGSNVIKYLNGDDFRCPISLELMVDPVTISTGHTYDRCSILKWFSSGNRTSPKTGEKVICTNLVPNLALKGLIKQYCVDNGVPMVESCGRKRDLTKTVVAGSAAAGEAMKMAADFLVASLVGGTSEERNKAAYEIRLLTKTSIFNRSCLVESGVIPSLLDLLCVKDRVSEENAIAALLNLSKFSKSKRILVENDGLEVVLDVVKNGFKMEARQHAAGTLFYLASVEEYRILIGKIPSAMPVLMELILDGSDRGKKNALVAVFGLLMHEENHWRALAAGVVPLLLDLLRSSQREDLITDSLAVLATLADKLDGAMVILGSTALDTIVGVLGSCTSRAAKEYCVSLLLALCINGGADVVLVLVKNPSLMGPLYSLLTDGSSRGGKKASSLIRLLHEFNEKSSSQSRHPGPALVHGQFIHVW